MESLSEKILKIIQERKMSPLPRWNFLLKKYLLLVCLGLTSLVGALSVSVILHKISTTGIEMLPQPSHIGYFFTSLPYLWLVLFALMIFLVFVEVSNTEGGYRLRALTIILASLVLSMIFGFVMYAFNVGGRADRLVFERFPHLQQKFNNQVIFWNNPEDGRLIGVIQEFKNDRLFILDSFGRRWEVQYVGGNYQELLNLRLGHPLRLIGEQISTSNFEASKFMPVFAPPKWRERK